MNKTTCTRACIAILVTLLGGQASAQNQQSYLRVVDKITGFAFDARSQNWDVANFRPESKYVVKKGLPNLPNAPWVVMTIGKDFPSAVCKEDFNEKGILSCEGFRQFRMNKKNMRFLSFYPFGYYSDGVGQDGKEGGDTPVVEIGRCTSL